MHAKLRAVKIERGAIILRATNEMELVSRPVQNEVRVHFHQARDMLERAVRLDLTPPVYGLQVTRLMQQRLSALKLAYQLRNFPERVEVEDHIWPGVYADEEGLAIAAGLCEADVHATLVGYLNPYIRAIGIRGLDVRAFFGLTDDYLYVKLSAPVFP